MRARMPPIIMREIRARSQDSGPFATGSIPCPAHQARILGRAVLELVPRLQLAALAQQVLEVAIRAMPAEEPSDGIVVVGQLRRREGQRQPAAEVELASVGDRQIPVGLLDVRREIVFFQAGLSRLPVDSAGIETNIGGVVNRVAGTDEFESVPQLLRVDGKGPSPDNRGERKQSGGR